MAGCSKTSCGGPGLLHAALIHQHHLVSDVERLFLIVRDEDAGDVRNRRAGGESWCSQFLSDLSIQGAEWLIEQQDFGAGGQGRAKATRCRWPPDNWLRITPAEFFEPDQLQKFMDASSRTLASDHLRTRKPNATFSKTVMCRNKA